MPAALRHCADHLYDVPERVEHCPAGTDGPGLNRPRSPQAALNAQCDDPISATVGKTAFELNCVADLRFGDILDSPNVMFK
jgi:hypothetical protein